jgi:aminoglycoside 6-adenylyltransferase
LQDFGEVLVVFRNPIGLASPTYTAYTSSPHLFRSVAQEVADHLAYQYPQDMDQRVVAYLSKVRSLDKQAAGIE